MDNNLESKLLIELLNSIKVLNSNVENIVSDMTTVKIEIEKIKVENRLSHDENSSKKSINSINSSIKSNEFKSFEESNNNEILINRLIIRSDHYCGYNVVNKAMKEQLSRNQRSKMGYNGIDSIKSTLYKLVSTNPTIHLPSVLNEYIDDSKLDSFLKVYYDRLYNSKPGMDTWMSMYEIGMLAKYFGINIVVLIMDNNKLNVCNGKFIFMNNEKGLVSFMEFKINHFNMLYPLDVININAIPDNSSDEPALLNIVTTSSNHTNVIKASKFIKINYETFDVNNNTLNFDCDETIDDFKKQQAIKLDHYATKVRESRYSGAFELAKSSTAIMGTTSTPNIKTNHRRLSTSRPRYGSVMSDPDDDDDDDDSSSSSDSTNKPSKNPTSYGKKKLKKSRDNLADREDDRSQINVVVKRQFDPSKFGLILDVKKESNGIQSLPLETIARWVENLEKFKSAKSNDDIAFDLQKCVTDDARLVIISKNIDCWMSDPQYSDFTKFPSNRSYPGNIATFHNLSDNEVMVAILRTSIGSTTTKEEIIRYLRTVSIFSSPEDEKLLGSDFKMYVNNFELVARITMTYASRMMAIAILIRSYGKRHLHISPFGKRHAMDHLGNTTGLAQIMHSNLQKYNILILDSELRLLPDDEQAEVRSYSLEQYHQFINSMIIYWVRHMAESKSFLNRQSQLQYINKQYKENLDLKAKNKLSLLRDDQEHLESDTLDQQKYFQAMAEQQMEVFESMDHELVADNSLYAITENVKGSNSFQQRPPSNGSLGDFTVKSQNDRFRNKSTKGGPCFLMKNCPFYKSGKPEQCTYSHDPVVLDKAIKAMQEHVQEVKSRGPQLQQLQSHLEQLFIVAQASNEDDSSRSKAQEMLKEILSEGTKLSAAYIQGDILDNSSEGRQC